MIFIILNTLKTMSLDTSAEGSNKTMQTKTPNAQDMLISWEDLRFCIRKIKGILQRGNIIAAIIPIILIIFYFKLITVITL